MKAEPATLGLIAPRNVRRLLVPVDSTPDSLYGLRLAGTVDDRYSSNFCLLYS